MYVPSKNYSLLTTIILYVSISNATGVARVISSTQRWFMWDGISDG
jgi:hypothetical protein